MNISAETEQKKAEPVVTSSEFTLGVQRVALKPTGNKLNPVKELSQEETLKNELGNKLRDLSPIEHSKQQAEPNSSIK